MQYNLQAQSGDRMAQTGCFGMSEWIFCLHLSWLEELAKTLVYMSLCNILIVYGQKFFIVRLEKLLRILGLVCSIIVIM